MKECLICKESYHEMEFTKDKSKKDGLSIYCRKCRRKVQKEYKNSKKENYKSYRKKYNDANYNKNRNYALKHRYGITLDEFEQKFKDQGQVCGLCNSPESDSRNFVMDHCHKTGKNRDILCSYCNRALGMFKDSKEILKKAIEYLKKHSKGDF